MTLIDVPRLDRGKVWQLRWVPVARDSYREEFSECEGLTPDDAEVIKVNASFGDVQDLFLRCGNCGVQANSVRLIPGISVACPGCFTVYRLEVETT